LRVIYIRDNIGLYIWYRHEVLWFRQFLGSRGVWSAI